MTTKSRLLTYVILLGLVDAVVPLFPVLAIVLIHVILVKPPWFLSAVKEIYQSK